MKANDGSGNIPERDLWKTPKWLIVKLDSQYDFGFDCCANTDDTIIKESDRFSNNFELISKEYLKYFVCWMNPPFSKAKVMLTHFFKVVKSGVAIYRCDNLETDIWQTIIFPNCSWIFIPNKRIVYDGLNGNGARFPSALIGLNVDPPKGLDGTCLKKG